MSFRYAKKENYTQEDLEKILENHSTYSKKGLISIEDKDKAIEEAKTQAITDYKETTEYKDTVTKLKGFTQAEFSRTAQENEDFKKLLNKIPEDRRAREIKALKFDSEKQDDVNKQLEGIVNEFYSSNPPAAEKGKGEISITVQDNPYEIER